MTFTLLYRRYSDFVKSSVMYLLHCYSTYCLCLIVYCFCIILSRSIYLVSTPCWYFMRTRTLAHSFLLMFRIVRSAYLGTHTELFNMYKIKVFLKPHIVESVLPVLSKMMYVILALKILQSSNEVKFSKLLKRLTLPWKQIFKNVEEFLKVLFLSS